MSHGSRRGIRGVMDVQREMEFGDSGAKGLRKGRTGESAPYRSRSGKQSVSTARSGLDGQSHEYEFPRWEVSGDGGGSGMGGDALSVEDAFGLESAHDRGWGRCCTTW